MTRYALKEGPLGAANPRLLLIGIDPHDRVEGPNKLRQLYNDIKPSIVISPDHPTIYNQLVEVADNLERGLKGLTKDHRGIEQVVHGFNTLYFNFATIANFQHAQLHGIPHYPLGPMPLAEKCPCCLGKAEADEIVNVVKQRRGSIPQELIRGIEAAINDGPSQEYLEQRWNAMLHDELHIKREVLHAFASFMQLKPKVNNYAGAVRAFYNQSQGLIAFPLPMEQCENTYTKSTMYSSLADLNIGRIPLI